MTNINPTALRNVLCERLCQDVKLLERPDGELMLNTHFEFPDGDNFPIYVAASGGGARLSDRGHTLMHISYDHDIDAFLKGDRGQMLEHVANEDGVILGKGVLNLDTSVEELPEAISRFGQAITRVYDLTKNPVPSKTSDVEVISSDEERQLF